MPFLVSHYHDPPSSSSFSSPSCSNQNRGRHQTRNRCRQSFDSSFPSKFEDSVPVSCENYVTELKQCTNIDKIPYGRIVNANLLTLEKNIFLLSPSKASLIYICRIWYQKDLPKSSFISQVPSMAAMAPNFKISLHCRSKSEPSAPRPLILQLEENLQRFKSSEASPSSSSSSSSSSSIVCQNLIGLHDLHDCINKVLQWPNIQQALARGCSETLVDELLSVRLLDFSDAAKEALVETKENIKELQSAIRRGRGGQVVVAMRKFLSWRKKVKKAIRKTLENLKGNKKDINLTSSYKECDESVPMIRILKQTELITLSHLQSLLSFICASIRQSKHSEWSIVFKLMRPKRVACDYERANTSEFEYLDSILESLLCHKLCSVESIESFQSHLENLELSLRDLEEGIENLQSDLIRIRVSLLNIFNH